MSNSNQTDKDPSDIYGVGAGRRKVLEAIERTDPLDTVEPNALDELIEAVRDISLEWEDFVYREPPTDTIETIQSIHDKLPDEAQEAFVTDDVLRRRINAARSQFNDWMGRLKRSKEIPSPVEAGPANYPADKAKEKSQLRHEAGEDLADRIKKIEAGAKGARQRALEEIGSSVAEQNENQRKSLRERRREQLEAGDIVQYRSPRLQTGAILRVNKKSIRVRRPNPRAGQTKPLSDEPEPEYIEGRVGLDSDHLERIDDSELADYDGIPDTRPEAQEHLMGEKVDQ